jgi:hypothetical protein
LSGAGHGSAGKPFKVLHRLKPVFQILAQGEILDQFQNPVLPLANRLLVAQRIEQPLAQATGTHRRNGPVDNGQQRALALALVIGDQFEVRPGRFISTR